VLRHLKNGLPLFISQKYYNSGVLKKYERTNPTKREFTRSNIPTNQGKRIDVELRNSGVPKLGKFK
jgi:hypothetical protein